MADAEELEDQEEEEEEESSDNESGEELDYEALYNAEKSRADKLDNDRKSALGNQRTQRERDDQLNSISDAVVGLSNTVGYLVKATSSENVEGLQENVDKANREHQVRVASRGFAVTYDALYNQLGDTVEDEDGKTIIELDTDFVKAWSAAVAAQDIATLTNLSAKIQSQRLGMERETNNKLLADAKEAKKTGKSQTKKKKAGMDLGASSGGASAGGSADGGDLFKSGLKNRPDLKVR